MGLHDEYNEYENEKPEIGKYSKTFFELPILNPPDMNNAFTNGLVPILLQDYRVKCFADYI